MKRILIILCFLLSWSVADAADLHICPNGSGAGDQSGSSAANCDDGIDDLNALDPATGTYVVYFGDSSGDPATFESNAIDLASWTGTYTLTLDGNGSTFSGQTEQPINLDDNGGGASWSITTLTVQDFVIVDHDGILGGEFVHIQEIDTVYMDNIDINGHTNASETATGTRGIEIYEADTFVEVKNCTIQNLGPNPIAYAERYGIQIYDSAGYHHIFDNTIHDIGADGINIGLSGSAGNRSKIYDNEVYDCYEEAIDMKGAWYVDVYNNDLYRSGDLSDVDGLLQILASDSEWGGYDSYNIKIYENYFHGNVETYTISLAGSSPYVKRVYDINIYRNYFSGNAGVLEFFNSAVYNTNFYENVIASTSGAGKSYPTEGIIRFASSLTGNRIRSNSFYSTENTWAVYLPSGWENADHIVEANAFNLTHASAFAYYDANGSAEMYPTWNTWLTGGNELYIDGGVQGSPYQNNSWEDPQFQDVGSGDLSLTITSNARGNAGGSNESTNGLKDGSTWTPSFSVLTTARDDSPDAGAYEYTQLGTIHGMEF